jgi:hypothetical protein
MNNTYNPPSQPSWLRNESTHDDVQPLNSNVQHTQMTPELIQRARLIHNILRAVTILLCLLMASTAVVGISKIYSFINVLPLFVVSIPEYISDIDTSGKIFICTYMLFFSILLLVFELNEIKKIEYIEHFYRRNFGFIYKALGKALFIILYVIS